MSNQYKNALHYAEEELRSDLRRWGIVVDIDKRIIRWKDIEVKVEPGTSKQKVKHTLKKFIQAAIKYDKSVKQTVIV